MGREYTVEPDYQMVNGYLVVGPGPHNCAGGTVESNGLHEEWCGYTLVGRVHDLVLEHEHQERLIEAMIGNAASAAMQHAVAQAEAAQAMVAATERADAMQAKLVAERDENTRLRALLGAEPPTELIRTCPGNGVAGHCPACHRPVLDAEEVDGGPVWTCRYDLTPGNPHGLPRPEWITEELMKEHGNFSNCPEEHGAPCDMKHMPLHEDCYGLAPY